MKVDPNVFEKCREENVDETKMKKWLIITVYIPC